MILTLVVLGSLISGGLLILALIELNKVERRNQERGAASLRLQSVLEAGRLVRDAEAHEANLQTLWRG